MQYFVLVISKIEMINIYKAAWLGNFKLYSFINIAVVLSIAFLIFLSPVQAIDSSAMAGLDTAAKNGFSGEPAIQDVPSAIGSMVGLALSFVGLAFFVLMIYGGFIWMFARGNDQDVQKAKDLIQAAIIGLIIVLMAYAITMFIGNALTEGSGGSTPDHYGRDD